MVLTLILDVIGVDGGIEGNRIIGSLSDMEDRRMYRSEGNLWLPDEVIKEQFKKIEQLTYVTAM